MTRSSEETALTKAILDALKRCGYRAIRINSGCIRVGTRFIYLAPEGTPDILVLHPYAWVECKDLSRVSPAQSTWHAWAKSVGVPVTIGKSPKQVLEFVKGLER